MTAETSFESSRELAQKAGINKILIVEDEHTIAEGVELYFRKEGFETERAGDGKRALELWRAFRPDLILLDIGLPGIDGLEVLKTLRVSDRVPVIMMTARAEEIDELLGLGLGADNYITKPFSLRVLTAHVRAVLKRHAPVVEQKPLRVRYRGRRLSHERSGERAARLSDARRIQAAPPPRPNTWSGGVARRTAGGECA